MLPLAVVTAGCMLAAWFPLATYRHQQAQLSATAAQISAIQRQERSVELQARSIASRASATLLARQQYQLVAQGQSLIQVLPGKQAGRVLASSGDPGLQPLVSPSSVSTLVNSSGPSHGAAHRSDGFLQRLVRTFEFWR